MKIYRFRNRKFTTSDINQIKRIINQNWKNGRTKIAKIICQKFNWKSINNTLKVVACLDALKRMANKNLIELPPPKITRKHNRKIIKFNEIGTKLDRTKIKGKIDDFKKIRLETVKNEKENKLFRYLIQKYHYLGDKLTVGRHIKYLIYLDNNLVGAISFGDAVLHHNIRDKWIGWNKEKRMKNLHLIVNNVRFLILPWIEVKNLGSKVLSLASRILPIHWEIKYGYKPVMLETFVELDRFKGTVYKASNWILLGKTEGKSRSGLRWFINKKPKELYVYPLCKDALLKLNGNYK